MPLTFKEQPREMVGMDEWHLSSCVKLHHDPVFMVGHALWPFPALAWRLSHLPQNPREEMKGKINLYFPVLHSSALPVPHISQRGYSHTHLFLS